jgi:hypothetical protein
MDIIKVINRSVNRFQGAFFLTFFAVRIHQNIAELFNEREKSTLQVCMNE